jgi:hypothetical protein
MNNITAFKSIPQDIAEAIDAANATDVKALDLAATISAYFYDPITYGKEQKKWNTHSGGQYAVISGLLNSLNRRINSESTSYYTKSNGEQVRKFSGIKPDLRANIVLSKKYETDAYDGDRNRVNTKCEQLHSELLLATQFYDALAAMHLANTGKEFKPFDLQEKHDDEPDTVVKTSTRKANLKAWEKAVA